MKFKYIILLLSWVSIGVGQNYDALENFQGLSSEDFLDDNGSTIAVIQSDLISGSNNINSEDDYGLVVTKSSSNPWQGAALIMQDNYLDLTTVRTIEVSVFSEEPTFILAKAVDALGSGVDGATDAFHLGGGWQTLVFNFDIPKDGPLAGQDEFTKLFFFPLWNGSGFDGSANNSPIITTAYDNVKYKAGSELFNCPDIDAVFDVLVWSDEFNGNGVVDNNNWYHQTQLIAGNSWANNEQQHYTDRIDNSYVSNGTLKIVAKGETYNDQGVTKQYTSARLNSKFSFQYGRVEVRAKLPSIAGTWPAIWLLGKNINEDGAYWDNLGYGNSTWPYCGEIDIMEPNIPKTEILGTWHWDNGSGYFYNSGSIEITNQETSQEFHVYSLEWSCNSMKIYLDDVLINQMDTFTPFDKEFYILFNVAMGGNLGGTIIPNFNQDQMEIDYVRVYQESTLAFPNQNQIEKVSFYPNPVTDILTINALPDNKINQIYIRDLSGRIVFKHLYKQGQKEINFDLYSLNSGMYITTLALEKGFTNSFKFIKK